MPRIGMEPMRRKALIAAAIEAIHDRGMGQVTMGEIARRAGVSAALAHHYFGGKDQLLLATMRHLLTELGEEIQARLAAATTPQERISAVIRGNFADGAVPPRRHLGVARLLRPGAERPGGAAAPARLCAPAGKQPRACAARADHARERAPRSPRPPPR